MICDQIQLIRADIDDHKRFLNARDVLNTLLDKKLSLLSTKNNTVAIEEFRLDF